LIKQKSKITKEKMLKTIKILAYISLVFLSPLSAMKFDDKMYLNEDEVKTSYDRFHIHIGENVWIETNALNRDQFGLFTFNSNIASIENSPLNAEYVKKWRCPHCNKYWPIGIRCQNTDCPSKYM
jgi:hypothetical protein